MVAVATPRKPVSLRFSDVSGQKKVKVKSVGANTTVGELAHGLLADLKLPRHDVEGRPVNYQVHLEREGRQVHGSELVGDALREDDQLVLQPDIMAG